MRTMKPLLFIAMLLAPLVGARAKQDSAAHARLLSAKTACLHLGNGSDKDLAEARRELKTWGRFKLVDDCSSSDVAIWITARYVPEAEICGAIVQVQGISDKAILWTGNKHCKTKTDEVVGQLVRQLRADMTHMKK